MSDLLPSTPDITGDDDADPRVVGLDSEDADELLSALSSETARKLLTALHDEPSTPSAVAKRVDTSLQNAQYHLKKLEDADIIEPVDTVYSEKGREMTVYAPASKPLVVFAGDEESSEGLREALAQLLGAVGAIGLASLAVQALVGRGSLLGGGGGDGGAAVADGGTTAAAPEAGRAPEATPQPVNGGLEPIGATAEATRTTAETAASAGASVPPGLAFFAGATAVLLAGAALWYTRG